MSRAVCIVEGCSRHPGSALICRRCEALVPTETRLAVEDHRERVAWAGRCARMVASIERHPEHYAPGAADPWREEAALEPFLLWSWRETISIAARQVAEERDALELAKLRARIEQAEAA